MKAITKEIKIHTEYITLGQLLKICDFVSAGGEEKFFLMNNKVLINHLEDNRRGRKLYKGDSVEILGVQIIIC